MAKTFLSIMAGTALVGGGIIFFYQRNKPKQIIPDAILISFLKELKSQSYPHFFLVAGIVEKLKMDAIDDAEFALLFE